MKFIFFITFILPTVLSTKLNNVDIQSDDDCWSQEKNNTIRRNHGTLVTFSTTVAYGNDDCAVHILNPWLLHTQNGFGLFLSREMDCASTLTIDCLSDSVLINQTKPLPVQFTCHTSQNKIQMGCSEIRLRFRRKIQSTELKRRTLIQVVALAKEPCIDDEISFQCPKDYPNSCIDKMLRCNGRSECASGDDERDCHPIPPSGVSIFVLILIILAFLFLLCIFSLICVCCCFRSLVRRIIEYFRKKKGLSPHEKNNIATGEDDVLMKELTTEKSIKEIQIKTSSEPIPLSNESIQPIYPRLE